MKLAVLTQIPRSNYGCVLQNYALQTILERAGHKVVTFNYLARTVKSAIFEDTYSIISYLIKRLLFYPERRINKLPWQDEYKSIIRFTKKHLHLWKLRQGIEENIVRKHRIDRFIVGSDQVWRPHYNKKTLNWMFCDFLPIDSLVPIVAYAASFGVDEWEYTPEQTEMAQRNIRRFKAVSVREASGIKLCREHLGVGAVHVLDPTLLLQPSEYMALVPKRTLAKVPEGCVGVYILDLTDRKREIVETVCRVLGKRPVYFGCRPEGKTKFPSVENWLAHFERSSFIITDSFHGTAFSINFRRPFISIANQARGADRFTSLLDSMGLRERLIDEEALPVSIEELAKTVIDWERVNFRLCSLRKLSMEFLDKALQK